MLFHTSLVENIKRKYKNTKNEREKQLIARVVSGNILKKYRHLRLLRKSFGFSKKRHTDMEEDLSIPKKRRKSWKSVDMAGRVRSFLLRDDVSRMTPGSKQTITQKKQKMQKRLLTDTLKDLHRKCLSEGHGPLSYTTFCRLRPFWVVTPSDADRNTCLCKTHENTQLMANVLHSRGILSTKSTEDIADSVVCNAKEKACAYGECRECLLNAVSTLKQPGVAEVCVPQWTTEKVNKNEKSSLITVKRDLLLSESDLLDKFQNKPEVSNQIYMHYNDTYAFPVKGIKDVGM